VASEIATAKKKLSLVNSNGLYKYFLINFILLDLEYTELRTLY